MPPIERDLRVEAIKQLRRIPERYRSEELRQRILALLAVIPDPLPFAAELKENSFKSTIRQDRARAIIRVNRDSNALVEYLETPLKGRRRKPELPAISVEPDSSEEV